ncbi:MAG: hypothetical protein K2V38_06360 [Gemmataceae bacterium]|nr:hypothetical protein [Gemmataceae bacterium]
MGHLHRVQREPDGENNVASRSAQQHGINVSNSADNPVVRGNAVGGNRGSGIQLNADGRAEPVFVFGFDLDPGAGSGVWVG